jgi:ketosteroid isomerase-like protein
MPLATFAKADVEQFTREFEALFNAGDAPGMAAWYTPDAHLLAEDNDLVRGRAAIEEFWRSASQGARAANARRVISLDEVTSSGDLGYALGTVTVQFPGDGGPGRAVTFKYATIWHRGPGGQWQLAVDTSNRNAPL